MLAQSDTNIAEVLARLSDVGIEPALLVPTDVGMAKSIMDATKSVRSHLLSNHIHDFKNQPQGQSHKKLVPAFIVLEDRLIKTKVSLYRPETKRGDPRIWVYSLGKYANPWNLIALICHERELYVINCSKPEILRTIGQKNSPASFLNKQDKLVSYQAGELLMRLRDISRQGPHRAITVGDTAVGMTLEALLGIPPNASKVTDYNGIELKAHRSSFGRTRTRSTLFSQVPNWKLSVVSTAEELLNKCGYTREGVLRLYCTLSTANVNSQGLYLELEQDDFELWSKIRAASGSSKVNLWEVPRLHERLLEKHPETFWVRAQVSQIDGIEHFHFDSTQYTRYPSTKNFDLLIEAGKITLDYTVRLRSSGAIRDHGYLFKINRSDLGALFPEPIVFPLI